MSGLNEELVRNTLRTVIDPELGANLVDLGMVRRIEATGETIAVDLVLTTPDCPLAGLIVQSARQAIERLPGVKKVAVNILDEPWQPPGNEDWQSWVDGAAGWGAW